jgi:diguanylate cyclase (GGDEF)-like protein
VALPFRDTDEVIEVLVPLPGDEGGSTGWVAAALMVSLLLLPLGVSAVVDLLGLLPHLRWKLVGAFGLAAVLPLATLTVVLVRSFEQRVESDVASELRSHGASVDRALRAARERARRLATSVAEEETLMRTLAVTDPTDRTAALDALARERSAGEGPGVVVAIETVRREEGRRVRRTYPLRAVPAPLQGVYEPENGLHYRWSRLVATGIANTRTEDTRVSVVVEIPVDEEALERLRRTAADRAHLRLFSPDGYPVASTLEVPGSATPEAVEDRRATADALRRDPGEDLLRRESLGGLEHEVAWRLLRDGDRTVGLLATAVPRRPLQAATLGTRDLLLVLGAAALLLAVLVANLVTHRLSAPVTALAQVARRVEEGDLDVRATPTSQDELGALADAFNGMTSQLRGRIDELSRLNSHLGDLVGTLERPRVLDLTVETFRDAADPDGLLVLVADDAEKNLEVAAGWRFGEPLVASSLPATGRIARLLEGEGAATDALPPLTEGAGDAEADLLSGFRSCTALPFSAGGGRTRGGILLLHSVPATDDDAGRLDFLAALAHQAAIALENARLYRLAVEDPETGLYGPTYFRKRMQEEIDRGLEAGRPVSLVLAAFEGMDALVREGGPDAGSEALRGAVDAMRGTLRSMHLAARWDREEIAVLLPETPRGVADEIAESLRAAVASSAGTDDLPPLRLAVGVATAPEDAGSAAFLEDAAGRGLREARERRGAAEPAATFGAPAGVDQAEAESLGFRSAKSLLLLDALNRVATSDVPVLVLGETGAGKEVVADIVHGKSRRSDGPLVKVNCAALPGPLLESELFGYERGAFTGADRRHAGRFEQADGGTLFLDEIGEMPTALQVKLLRVLQDGRVQRLGGTEAVDVDVRIIAATNRDLPALIEAGQFREDLYFRLNVLSVVVPPLRARREDIPLLAERFLRQASLAHGGGTRQFTPEALDLLHRHSFPGNVRELRNMVERAVVGAKGDRITPGDLSFGQSARVTATPAPARTPTPAPAPSAGRVAADVPSDLSPRGRRLLTLLRRRGTMTNSEWSKQAGISSRTGLRDFDELLDRGLIVREGKRRGARYRPAD